MAGGSGGGGRGGRTGVLRRKGPEPQRVSFNDIGPLLFCGYLWYNLYLESCYREEGMGGFERDRIQV